MRLLYRQVDDPELPAHPPYPEPAELPERPEYPPQPEVPDYPEQRAPGPESD